MARVGPQRYKKKIVFLRDTFVIWLEATETRRWIVMYDKIKYILSVCICWFVK